MAGSEKDDGAWWVVTTSDRSDFIPRLLVSFCVLVENVNDRRNTKFLTFKREGFL